MGDPIGDKSYYLQKDLNNLTANGIYVCYYTQGDRINEAHYPNTASTYFQIVVYRTVSWIKQIATNVNSLETFVRVKDGDKEWSPWQRIDNFGYNSLAELSAGILSTQRKWLNSGDDLNNVIETGIYRAGGATVENNPTAATYFMLIVESFDESSILQKFIHNDGRVWFRSRYGSEWREWKQIV